MGRGCPPISLAARLPKAGNVISVTQTDQHWLLAPGGENPSHRGGEGRCWSCNRWIGLLSRNLILLGDLGIWLYSYFSLDYEQEETKFSMISHFARFDWDGGATSFTDSQCCSQCLSRSCCRCHPWILCKVVKILSLTFGHSFRFLLHHFSPPCCRPWIHISLQFSHSFLLHPHHPWS